MHSPRLYRLKDVDSASNPLSIPPFGNPAPLTPPPPTPFDATLPLSFLRIPYVRGKEFDSVVPARKTPLARCVEEQEFLSQRAFRRRCLARAMTLSQELLIDTRCLCHRCCCRCCCCRCCCCQRTARTFKRQYVSRVYMSGVVSFHREGSGKDKRNVGRLAARGEPIRDRTQLNPRVCTPRTNEQNE